MAGKNCPFETVPHSNWNSWRAYSTSSGNFGVPMAVSQDATNWWWVQQDALPDRGQWVDSVDQAIWSPDVMQNVNSKNLNSDKWSNR